MTYSNGIFRVYAATAWLVAVCAGLAGCQASPHDLVARGQLDALRHLLQSDPDAVNRVDRLRKTALHTAAGVDEVEAIRLLLDAGADIGARDVTGMTPLHVAAVYSRRRAATLLLERGADLHARDAFGDTPLHTAAIFGRTKMAIWLIRQGADPCAPNAAGRLPLDLARERRHRETMDALTAYVCP